MPHTHGPRHLPNSLAETPPADWPARLREALGETAALLLRKVQHGKLRGGGTDVYTGYSGIAFAFLSLHSLDPAARWPLVLEDGATIVHETALQIARRYADTAVHLLASTTPSANDVAFLTSPTGALAVAAGIDMESNRQPAAEEKVRAILTALRRTDLPSAPSDLLYGLPGLLYTSRFLRSHSLQLPQQVIQSAFDACIQEGLRTARSGEFRTLGMRMGLRSFPPLFWRFFGKSYLGAAHGLAGVLCELLHHPRLLETPASRYSDSPEVAESSIGDLVLQTIQWLVPFADPNLPSSLDSMGTDLVQWCHGSPGFAVLLEKAIQVFGGEGFQDPLQTCGEVVWEKGLLTKGVGGLLSINELLLLSQRRTFPGLCHGISGNAYTFLALLRTSIHPQQNLNRAIQFAIFARDWQKLTEEGTLRHPDHMYSLFEGAAGYLCLLVELLKISERKESLGFPCQADVGDAEGVEQVALGT